MVQTRIGAATHASRAGAWSSTAQAEPGKNLPDSRTLLSRIGNLQAGVSSRSFARLMICAWHQGTAVAGAASCVREGRPARALATGFRSIHVESL